VYKIIELVECRAESENADVVDDVVVAGGGSRLGGRREREVNECAMPAPLLFRWPFPAACVFFSLPLLVGHVGGG